MIADSITIRPIRLDEWLPDRCLNGLEPFDPNSHAPELGCPNINYFKKNNRETLEQLYQLAISKYGGCGFIAWDKETEGFYGVTKRYSMYLPLDYKY